MKIGMTERDKKLLIFLTIFVIVVCIGYWGIFPNVKSMRETEKKIEEARELEEENKLKISKLPELEKKYEDMQQEVSEYKESFFEEMSSDKVDKYLTSMALDYNLYAYDLNISMPTDEALLNPYYLSEKVIKLEDENADITDEGDNITDEINENDMDIYEKDENESDDVDEAFGEADEELDVEENETKIPTGIYCVKASFKVGGEEKNLLRLIDDLSYSEKKIRISNYSWVDERNVSYNEDGSYEIDVERILNITIEMYMCKE